LRGVTRLPSLQKRREPSQLRSKARVERIIAAAAKLIERGGLESVTTNAIAREAKLPVGTLYQFFPNREAVLQALIESQLSELDAPLRPLLSPGALGLAERVEKIVDVLFDTYRRLPALAQLMHASRGDPRVSPLAKKNNALVSGWVVPLVHAEIPEASARAAAISLATVEAADAVLMAALREPDGRKAKAVLFELKEMLRAYVAGLSKRR
jgi:AcrR family transcriptional regulator